ncbi:hypothetical protein [Sulfitobacter litoralis]|uniref:hypothetical protein n=1 Tax=Sulfitobacter litoralis TaxID=335975 RepID=UPI002B26CE2A|nr:hypothetical protein [Sulfitobacter litoralis]
MLGLVANAAIAVLGLMTSFWLSEQISLSAEQSPPVTLSYLDVMIANIFNFGEPLVYFVIAIVISLITSSEGIFNRYHYGERRKIEASLRMEKQEHGTTKRNYYETLAARLKNLLATRAVGFDETCRVTVYRKQAAQDLEFKRVFRFSRNHKFCNEGRVKVPIDQGFIGIAWANHGEKEFSISDNFGTARYNAQLAKEMEHASCTVPPSDLSMPSKHFYAKAVDDLSNGKRVGIVVFESTDADKLDTVAINQLMVSETLEVSRCVRHLGVLDSEFNPDPDVEEVDG